MSEIDVRMALNAVSDVVQNRPLPLREFDQIYMKTGDLFLYAETLSRRLHDKELLIVGDGDGIGLTVAHLFGTGVVRQGPKRVHILDFDERMVLSIKKFASHFGYGHVDAELYNVVDPLPDEHLEHFDAFHINPPWGQYNNGESVKVFLERGMLGIKNGGLGIVAIGHSQRFPWTGRVLQSVQEHANLHNAHVIEMIPEFHTYHLDDAPELTSCCMFIQRHGSHTLKNTRLEHPRWEDFYGRDRHIKTRYVLTRGDYAFHTESLANYEIEDFRDH